MAALNTWNGGVIIISHDERFITSVAKEVRNRDCTLTVDLTYPVCIALGMWRWHGYAVQG